MHDYGLVLEKLLNYLQSLTNNYLFILDEPTHHLKNLNKLRKAYAFLGIIEKLGAFL